MAKKGVSRITGNTSPKTGEKALYKVTEWYPATPAHERKESLVTWELFRKRSDGKFMTTNIKKKVGEFTFGKDAWQYTYRVEGYLDKPEGKDPMSIIVQPQKNEQQAPPKEKDILGVKLTFQDGSPVNKKISYKDRLWATAKCQGMEGEHIIFTLWEDDEKGDGHNKKNQSIVKSSPILVDSQGYARWNFALLTTYITIANQREDDKKQHEYYVTAEYKGKLKASDNANANNPDYKAPPAPPKKPAGNNNGGKSQPKPPPQPKPDSPKGSTRPNSPNNQPDKKGVIKQIKLTDKNGKAFTKNPKFGETIRVSIDSYNLVGKKYTLKIWEHDLIGDDLLYSKEHTFLTNHVDVLIPLTEQMQKTGEIGSDPKNPDSGEYWKGGQQEIFAEVILLNISSKSQTIDVDIMEAPKPQNNGNSASGVKDQPKPEAPKAGECPRCKKLTEDELKKVFPRASDPNLISEIVKVFNEYCEKFNINSCTLKAHFFAQAKQESSDSISPAIDGELMNYSVKGLLTTGLKNVSSKYKFGKKTGIDMAKDLGRKDGEGALSIDRQIKIANFIYGLNPKATDLGNKAPADNLDLSEVNNEGWRYRGRGMLQITGKNNYTNIENHVNTILGKSVLDIKSGRKYNLKFTPTEALLTGLGDWSLHKMYIPAKKGVTKEACLEVIRIINSATKSKTKRVAHLIGGLWYSDDDTTKSSYTIQEQDSMKYIFRVDECLSNKMQSPEPITPIQSKVVITFGENADKSVVSEKSLNLLREVGEKTKNYIINITSTARDPYNQARVMYDNILKNGMATQRSTYKAPGQRVLDAYEAAKAKGKNRQEIIKAMEAKIRELGPTKVSKHCEDPKIMNVFDISQAMSNPKDFKREITSKVYRVLDENACYHVEIKQ